MNETEITDIGRIQKASTKDLMFTADQFDHRGPLRIPSEVKWNQVSSLFEFND